MELVKVKFIVKVMFGKKGPKRDESTASQLGKIPSSLQIIIWEQKFNSSVIFAKLICAEIIWTKSYKH